MTTCKAVDLTHVYMVVMNSLTENTAVVNNPI